MAILGVILGQAVQILAAKRRDGLQQDFVREERVAGWRFEVYRDVLVWVDSASKAVEKGRRASAPDAELVARVELVGSEQVATMFRRIRADTLLLRLLAATSGPRDVLGADDSPAPKRAELMERMRTNLHLLREACRTELQRGGS